MDMEIVRNIFTTVPVDIVSVGLFAVVITLITLRFGASISIAFSLALLLAGVFYAALPDTYLLGPALSSIRSPKIVSGIFIAISVLLTAILYRATSTVSDDSARPLFAIATALATAVVVLTVWELSPILQGVWQFSPLVKTVFGPSYRVFWLLLAFITFAFVKS